MDILITFLGVPVMPIAQVIEISATSDESFEDAIQQGIEEASETFENISGAWIKEQKVKIEKGEIIEFKVNMQVTALVEEQEQPTRRSGSGRSSNRDNDNERENNQYSVKKSRRQE
jgi:dodecin